MSKHIYCSECDRVVSAEHECDNPSVEQDQGDREVLRHHAEYLADFTRKLMCDEQYLQDPTGQSQNIDDVIVGSDDEEVPETPRKSQAKKRPMRSHELFDIEEDEQEGPEDHPNLAAYFALFESITEADQVKICRAYANYLASKSVKNRQRYSSKTANWAQRRK